MSDDLSASLGGLQFGCEPVPDFSSGRPVSLQQISGWQSRGLPRFTRLPPEPPPPPSELPDGIDQLLEGLDTMLADANNLTLLDMADMAALDPPAALAQPAATTTATNVAGVAAPASGPGSGPSPGLAVGMAAAVGPLSSVAAAGADDGSGCHSPWAVPPPDPGDLGRQQPHQQPGAYRGLQHTAAQAQAQVLLQPQGPQWRSDSPQPYAQQLSSRTRQRLDPQILAQSPGHSPQQHQQQHQQQWPQHQLPPQHPQPLPVNPMQLQVPPPGGLPGGQQVHPLPGRQQQQPPQQQGQHRLASLSGPLPAVSFIPAAEGLLPGAAQQQQQQNPLRPPTQLEQQQQFARHQQLQEQTQQQQQQQYHYQLLQQQQHQQQQQLQQQRLQQQQQVQEQQQQIQQQLQHQQQLQPQPQCLAISPPALCVDTSSSFAANSGSYSGSAPRSLDVARSGSVGPLGPWAPSPATCAHTGTSVGGGPSPGKGCHPSSPSSQPWMPLSAGGSATLCGAGGPRLQVSTRGGEFERGEPGVAAVAVGSAGPAWVANVPGWGVPPELEQEVEDMASGTSTAFPLGPQQQQQQQGPHRCLPVLQQQQQQQPLLMRQSLGALAPGAPASSDLGFGVGGGSAGPAVGLSSTHSGGMKPLPALANPAEDVPYGLGSGAAVRPHAAVLPSQFCEGAIHSGSGAESGSGVTRAYAPGTAADHTAAVGILTDDVSFSPYTTGPGGVAALCAGVLGGDDDSLMLRSGGFPVAPLKLLRTCTSGAELLRVQSPRQLATSGSGTYSFNTAQSQGCSQVHSQGYSRSSGTFLAPSELGACAPHPQNRQQQPVGQAQHQQHKQHLQQHFADVPGMGPMAPTAPPLHAFPSAAAAVTRGPAACLHPHLQPQPQFQPHPQPQAPPHLRAHMTGASVHHSLEGGPPAAAVPRLAPQGMAIDPPSVPPHLHSGTAGYIALWAPAAATQSVPDTRTTGPGGQAQRPLSAFAVCQAAAAGAAGGTGLGLVADRASDYASVAAAGTAPGVASHRTRSSSLEAEGTAPVMSPPDGGGLKEPVMGLALQQQQQWQRLQQQQQPAHQAASERGGRPQPSQPAFHQQQQQPDTMNCDDADASLQTRPAATAATIRAQSLDSLTGGTGTSSNSSPSAASTPPAAASATATALPGPSLAPGTIRAVQRAAASAAAREVAGSTKAGRPRQRSRTLSTLADVIRLQLIAPGPHQLLVGNQDLVQVSVHADGRIECAFGEFRSISSLALAVLRQRNPNRRACDGWQEVKLNGVRLDDMRQEAVRLLAKESTATDANKAE